MGDSLAGHPLTLRDGLSLQSPPAFHHSGIVDMISELDSLNGRNRIELLNGYWGNDDGVMDLDAENIEGIPNAFVFNSFLERWRYRPGIYVQQ